MYFKMLHFSCFLLPSFSSDFLLVFCISSAVLCSFFRLQVDDVLITSLCCCVFLCVLCKHYTGTIVRSLILHLLFLVASSSLVHCSHFQTVARSCFGPTACSLPSILVVHFCAGNFVNLWDYIVCCKHRCRAMVLVSMMELICWFYFFCIQCCFKKHLVLCFKFCSLFNIFCVCLVQQLCLVCSLVAFWLRKP